MKPVQIPPDHHKAALHAVTRIASLARDTRAWLLHFNECPRDLAGQCALAAMLMATALGDPRTLRTGFYMKLEHHRGMRKRVPYEHAWCRVGATIVDATATQFSRHHRSVHVIRYDKDTRYIELMNGAAALDDIMENWRGAEDPAYAHLARQLRQRLS